MGLRGLLKGLGPRGEALWKLQDLMELVQYHENVRSLSLSLFLFFFCRHDFGPQLGLGPGPKWPCGKSGTGARIIPRSLGWFPLSLSERKNGVHLAFVPVSVCVTSNGSFF